MDNLSVNFFLWFIAVIVMIPIALWLLKRSPWGAGLSGPSHSPVRQVSSLSLSPTQRIVTIEVGEGEEKRWLVLGVTPQSITTLHTLSVSHAVPQVATETTLRHDAFYQLLKRLRAGERREN